MPVMPRNLSIFHITATIDKSDAAAGSVEIADTFARLLTWLMSLCKAAAAL
jgi:hypothetical protein